MSWPLAVAVYFVIWWIGLFAVLPFGVRTQDEAGDVVPGTPGSAPERPRFIRVLIANTVLASVIFAGVHWAMTHRPAVCRAMAILFGPGVCG